MKIKNAMQLKARINARAKEAGIPAQSMIQNYLFERLLERLSRSGWRDNVVIKGGMLISSLVGAKDARSDMPWRKSAVSSEKMPREKRCWAV